MAKEKHINKYMRNTFHLRRWRCIIHRVFMTYILSSNTFVLSPPLHLFPNCATFNEQ